MSLGRFYFFCTITVSVTLGLFPLFRKFDLQEISCALNLRKLSIALSEVEHWAGSRVPNDREQRLIALVAQGLKNSEVAEAIGPTKQGTTCRRRIGYTRVFFQIVTCSNRLRSSWKTKRRLAIPNPYPGEWEL
jgi:hypothetical protein